MHNGETSGQTEANHPSSGQIAAFACGDLDGDEFAQVLSHVNFCGYCFEHYASTLRHFVLKAKMRRNDNVYLFVLYDMALGEHLVVNSAPLGCAHNPSDLPSEPTGYIFRYRVVNNLGKTELVGELFLGPNKSPKLDKT